VNCLFSRSPRAPILVEGFILSYDSCRSSRHHWEKASTSTCITKELHSIIRKFRGIHSHSVLELNDSQKKLYGHQKVADIYPEYYLINVNNFNDTAKDPLDEWIYFLKNEQIEDTFKARGLKEASETLDILKMDEKERASYERYCDQLRYEASMYESTYVTGREEGAVIGEERKAFNTAEIMMRNGESDEKIVLYTGLAIEQVRGIRKKL
jgi:hypothetical protein